ncbi:hypothetical protein V2J09_000474 [Rumex salicifolius]
MMRVSSAVLASFLTASTVALSSCSAGEHDVVSDCSQRSFPSVGRLDKERVSSKEEKFAPKFDGLRFIETLVTAHRLVVSCCLGP